jgi:hypothetical protein
LVQRHAAQQRHTPDYHCASKFNKDNIFDSPNSSCDDNVSLGRGVRVAEGAGFENRCRALLYRGFESHPLRCFCPKNAIFPVFFGVFHAPYRETT